MRKQQIVATMKRFICLVLAVLLMSEAPSWDAIAAEPADIYADNSETAPESVGTWTELTDRRTENVKWFADSVGNLKVTVYDMAVHVETEDGWQEAEWFVEASVTETGEDDTADTEDSENLPEENAAASDSEEAAVTNEADSAVEEIAAENAAASDNEEPADTETGTTAYEAAEYQAGYDPEGSEVYTYIDIPEEYLVSEGYTLYSAKINFADIKFTGYTEEAESLTVGIFLGDGQEDETEDTADTGAGGRIENSEASETENTAAGGTEVTAAGDTEVTETGVTEDTDNSNTESTSTEADSGEQQAIRTALSGLIDLSEDSTGPVSFTLNTATLSAYISEEAQLIFGASMGSGLVTATTTDSESGMAVPLWEWIFTPSETTDDATGEEYYLVDGSINTENIDGDSEEPRIIGEIEEKRDSNTKYFLTEGGGEIAAVYPEPVHYEKDGEWIDIDNTLELKEENGEERYHNKDSAVDVSFATSSTADELVKINDGGNPISWGLAVAGPVAGTYSARRFSRQLYREDIERTLSESMEDGAGQAAGQWLVPGSLNAAVTEILQESMEESVVPADTADSVTTAGNGTAEDNGTADSNAAEVSTANGGTSENNNTGDNSEENASAEETITEDTDSSENEENITDENTVSTGEGDASSAENEETTEAENNAQYNMEQMKVVNQKEGGRYAEILPGIDIQYIINSVSIKENIIVKNKEAAVNDITLRISHPGTVLVKEEDGSITIREDKTSEEILYRFMAPFMYDSAGAYSEEVEYILAEASEATTLLTVRADKEWLLDGDREYPVTIDPVTETTQNSTTIADTFLREQGSAGNEDVICVGKNHYYGKCRGLVKFTNLPQLDKNALIYRAVFNLFQCGYTADSLSHFAVTAHEVTADWNESITMLSQQPSYDGIIALDYIDVMESSNGMFRKFDITSLVRKWYEENNYGILLKSDSEDDYAETLFLSSDNAEDQSEGYPSGIFYFKDTTGMESYWSYHEQSAGEAGTGYTNDFNGNLMFTVPDVTTAGGIMPLSISHVYNSGESDVDSRFGKGWRLNVMQTLTETSAYENYPYVYTDGDGTRHYFYEDENDGNKLKDEDGLGLTITQTSSSNSDLYRIIECKDKSRLVFDIWGYLRRETDPNGNTISYNYSPVTGAENCLTSASDGTGASVSFEYNSNYTRLTGIIYNGAEKRTRYTYDENTGFLTSITHTTERTSTYAYNFEGIRKLSRAKAADGSGIAYRYKYDQGVARVSMFSEIGNLGTTGQSVEVEYYNGIRTRFIYPGLDGDTTHTADNPEVTYLFDNYGRPVSVSDEDGAAASYSYYSEGRTNNRLKESGSMQRTVHNLLTNPGFDSTGTVTAQGDSWYPYKSVSCSSYGVVRMTDTGYLGDTSIRVTKTLGGSGFVAQNVTVAEAGTYTLSAYVKTSGITGTEVQTDGAGLMITYLSGDLINHEILGKKTIQGTTNTKIDNGWERVTMTFDVPEAGTSIKVMGGIFNSTGTAWFDCFQLERGDSASDFNLVNNAGFERVSGGSTLQAWTMYNGGTGDGRANNVSANGACYGSHSATLSGELGVTQELSQEINISGSEGDVYTLSGWSMARGSAIAGNEYRVSVEVRYSGSDRDRWNFDFRPYAGNWQFGETTFVIDDGDDSTDRTYTSLVVYIFYGNQYNLAYFDGIRLVKDNAASYVYDDEGNVVSASSAAESEGFSYDSNNNLTKLVNADGTSYSYGYDSKGNLMTAQTSDGQGYTFTYDSNGNPLTSVLTGSGDVAAGSTYYIRQKTSGKYLEVKGATDVDRTIVQQYKFNGGTNQQWKLVDAGGGYYYLQTMCSSEGRVLEVYQASTAAGAQVSIYTANQSEAQKWKLNKLDDGSYQIIAKCTGDANCLTNYQGSTSDSTAITSRPVNGTHSDQSWYLEPVNGKRIATSMDYTASGRQAASVTDALGNATAYSYDDDERLLTSTTDAAGTVTEYTYNAGMEQLTKVASDGKEVTYGYNYVRLTSIGHNGFTYGFSYDEFGNTTSVAAGDHTLVTNEYLPHNGMISKSTYGNDQYVEYSYTKDEQVSGVSYNGTAAFTYRYDSAGNITEMTDVASGVTYYYTSDLIGRPTVMRTNHGQALQVSYDEKNRTDAVISQVTDVTTETGFTYGDGSSMKPEAAITGVSVDVEMVVEYFYDELGRLVYRYMGVGDAGGDATYTYKDSTVAGQTSTLVSSVNEDNVTTTYTYDCLGNITGITSTSPTGTKRRSYVYDALGQLVRDNDQVQGRTTTYTYDAGGNITEKKIYAYTTSELGEVLDTITYGYGDDTWYDMMTSYDGQAITYDAIGNPRDYRDGMTLTWIRGRRLGTLTVGDTTAVYTYDDNGIRTSKTVNGTKTTYYLNGSAILTQICGETRLDFFYDEQGSVIGFKYNNGIYLFQKNIQGDIIGIENSAGTQVVAYSYDAWGKILSVTGTEANTIGQLNPFRYRGYYYDEESGLYYLNNRYYDSEVGRFISADNPTVFILNQGHILQYNMFAYCFNNAINNFDPNGLWTVGLSLGANLTLLVGISVSIGFAVDDNGNFDWQWSYSVPSVDNTISVGAFDAGIGISAQLTDRDTVYDLYGPATYIGASGGPGWYVGGDVISFSEPSDLNGKINGVQLTGGVGAGVDVHITKTNTKPVGIRGTKTLNTKMSNNTYKSNNKKIFKNKKLMIKAAFS